MRCVHGLVPEALVNVRGNYEVTVVVIKSGYMRERLNTVDVLARALSTREVKIVAVRKSAGKKTTNDQYLP